MPLDLSPHHADGLWLPAKPAIIRPADHSVLRPGYFRPVDRAERRAIVADLIRAKRLTPDEAKQAMLLVPVVGWAAGGAAQATFVSGAVSGSNTDTYSFTNGGSHYNFGSATRVIVAVAARASSGTPTISGTIGGAALATIGAPVYNSASTVAFVTATGFSNPGDISLIFSASQVRCAIAIYGVVGLKSATPVDGVDGDTSDPLQATMNVAAGGFVLGVIFSSGTQSGATWTNLTGDVTTLAAGWETNGNYSAAHANFATAQSGLTFTGDWTGTADFEAGAFVSMR